MPRTHKPGMARGDQAQMWRTALGLWIAGLRRDRGITQEDLAAAVGASHANIISQIENGRATLSPDFYRPLCDALRVPDRAFARVVLRLQDPSLYAIMYGLDPQLEAELRRSKRHPRVFGAKGKGGSKRVKQASECSQMPATDPHTSTVMTR